MDERVGVLCIFWMAVVEFLVVSRVRRVFLASRDTGKSRSFGQMAIAMLCYNDDYGGGKLNYDAVQLIAPSHNQLSRCDIREQSTKELFCSSERSKIAQGTQHGHMNRHASVQVLEYFYCIYPTTSVVQYSYSVCVHTYCTVHASLCKLYWYSTEFQVLRV
jgi:hypothetical protein